MRIAAPADRRFRRVHVKPQRKRGRRRLGWRLAQGAAFLAAIGYAGYYTAVLLDRAALFRVSRINVRGNSRLSAGEVIALLDGLRGQNILTVDLAAWRLRLLQSSWVEGAIVRRILPSTAEVTITERRPLGISRIGEGLYLIDSHGVVIDDYGPAYADIDLPIIHGLANGAGRDGLAVDGERAELAARLLSSVSRRDIADRISEVDVTEPSNAAVILKGDTAVIKLGSEDFLERLQSYFELSSALRERVPDIDYVDLRFDKRVYVRPVESQTPGRRAAAAGGTRPTP
jgi:cell division protein FtsQ